ncbi:hypothetical protein BD408DRAFT_438658 [Parasitella parasitica]|nr:hypothetical protein BD408DRAFT_438658 [Parasitella parasitica]
MTDLNLSEPTYASTRGDGPSAAETYMRSMKTPGSSLFDSFNAQLSLRLQADEETLVQLSSKKLIIQNCLTSEEIFLLKKLFPTLRFDFSFITSTRTNYFDAVSRCTVEMMIKTTQANKGALVHHGGDFLQHAMDGRHYIHSCRPTTSNIDYRNTVELCRVANRLSNLTDKSALPRFPKLESLIKQPNDWYCHGNVNRCEVECTNLIVELYKQFLSPPELCDLMDRKNCDRSFFSIIFDPSMLHSDTGFIPTLKIRFVVDRSTDSLTLLLDGDASRRQHFPLSAYIRFALGSHFVSGNSVFLNEIIETNHAGFLIGKIVRTGDVVTSLDDITRHPIWDSSLRGRCLVKTYELKSISSNPDSFSSYVQRVFPVPVAMYRTAMEYAGSFQKDDSTSSKLTWDAVYSHLLSQNDKLIENGTLRIDGYRLLVDDLGNL